MDAEVEKSKPLLPRFKRVKTEWQSVVLVCRRCSKKAKGGFGPEGKDSLVKAMRKAWKLKKGRKAEFGLVEVDCLKICPKKAVTVANGAHPERFLVIPRETPLSEVAAVLDLKPPPKG
jgi:predicted metal-binding protein